MAAVSVEAAISRALGEVASERLCTAERLSGYASLCGSVRLDKLRSLVSSCRGRSDIQDTSPWLIVPEGISAAAPAGRPVPPGSDGISAGLVSRRLRTRQMGRTSDPLFK